MEERRSKGQIEAEITAAFTQFEREHLGRGPKEARSYLIQDMLVIRLKGILTPAEQNLIAQGEGIAPIKQIRSRLIESSREILADIVRRKTGLEMVTLHTDLSTRTGERVFMIVLSANLEERLLSA